MRGIKVNYITRASATGFLLLLILLMHRTSSILIHCCPSSKSMRSLMGQHRVSSLNITNTASRSCSSFISSRTLQLELAGQGGLECLMTGHNPSVGLSGVAQITDSAALGSVCVLALRLFFSCLNQEITLSLHWPEGKIERKRSRGQQDSVDLTV